MMGSAGPRTALRLGAAACLGAAGCFCALLTLTSSARAWVITEDAFEEKSTEVGVVGRSFAFLSAGPTLDPPYAPEGSNPAARSIFDARLYASHKTSSYRLVVHNASTVNMSSIPVSLGGGLNLGKGVPPPRMLPLTFSHTQDNLVLTNITDWLYAEFRFDSLTLTVGRQPVSFGRGQAWHTNDLISTFALTEVDRLFKPGADAVRLDWSLPHQQNISAIAALGQIDRNSDYDFGVSGEGSSGLIQYKNAFSEGEVGFMTGYVRGDIIASLDGTTSALGFDAHAEITGTWLTETSLSTPSVEGDFYLKAVLGATFRPTAKLTVIPEVFYGGNGAASAEDYLPLFVSDRFQIGDQVAVGRYYFSLANMYEATPLTTVSWGMMANLGDPSALWYSFLRQSVSDNTSAQLGVYAPIGSLPQFRTGAQLPTVESEFGLYPYFFFAQLSVTL